MTYFLIPGVAVIFGHSNDALTALGKKEEEVFWLHSSFEVYSGLCIQLLTELEDK